MKLVYIFGDKGTSTRMSVTLDERLLEEALEVSGKRAKRKLIEEALKEFIRKNRKDQAIRHAGTIQIGVSVIASSARKAECTLFHIDFHFDTIATRVSLKATNFKKFID
jgi:metal-responsive CopG/Arc/MetJ family transcriptional regulator